MSVIDEIAAERRRQVEAEGWTPEHDDQHADGGLAKAAAAYALHAATGEFRRDPPKWWPWHRIDDTRPTSRDDAPIWGSVPNWWKPTTPRRDLIKAAALIAAEIERLDRAAAKHSRSIADSLDPPEEPA
jgi:hypothetical protein